MEPIIKEKTEGKSNDIKGQTERQKKRETHTRERMLGAAGEEEEAGAAAAATAAEE